jgi:tetratricopeptide (TPR) repeat protein
MTTDWQELLGWGKTQINDIRYIGYSYLLQGKYQIALTFFEALAVLDPNHLFDLQTLGAINLEMGKNLEALNYFDLALKQHPNHEITLLNKTKALFNLGYKKQGVALARKLQASSNKKIKDSAEAILISHP